ncbi:hypothetical protein JJC03_09960 [Flavobacterium oreochromis]|uniref:hypothetical protein n=1 Tax=Flavobacterium oreochromis TaxID=2906078 RepID=UPI000CDA46E2|nr:hypothetical protein [Flavobacterium oreochromis]POR19883.1 hypothetical protein BWK58_14225 [Flavobacterium columnare]QYS85537.1 hypothetical protein JJC03_09960 [Flavobacterium oreochromis]
MKVYLEKARNSVIKNLKPDDLAGAIKEQRGAQILDARGRIFDHISEVEGALNSIDNATNELNKQISYFAKSTKNINNAEINRLSKLREELTTLKGSFINSYNPLGKNPIR